MGKFCRGSVQQPVVCVGVDEGQAVVLAPLLGEGVALNGEGDARAAREGVFSDRGDGDGGQGVAVEERVIPDGRDAKPVQFRRDGQFFRSAHMIRDLRRPVLQEDIFVIPAGVHGRLILRQRAGWSAEGQTASSSVKLLSDAGVAEVRLEMGSGHSAAKL